MGALTHSHKYEDYEELSGLKGFGMDSRGVGGIQNEYIKSTRTHDRPAFRLSVPNPPVTVRGGSLVVHEVLVIGPPQSSAVPRDLMKKNDEPRKTTAKNANLAKRESNLISLVY